MKTTRRDALKLSGLTLGLTALSPLDIFGRIMQEAKYSTEKIRGNVSIFKGRGGTIAWLDTKDGYAVCDTQFPDYAQLLIDHLKELKDKPIKILLNTHHHGDHSAGNIAFEGLAEKIVAHENSKTNQMNSAKRGNREDSQLYPDTTFSEKWKEKLGKGNVECMYFGAAHTNGDSVIHYTESNVAHVGDLVFNRRHPYIDKSAGANIANWIEVLSSIRSHYDNDTKFICGHSGNGYDIKINKDDIAAAEDYFEKLLKVVKSDIDAGKSKEQILARTDIPGIEWEGDGIARSMTAAYMELAEE